MLNQHLLFLNSLLRSKCKQFGACSLDSYCCHAYRALSLRLLCVDTCLKAGTSLLLRTNRKKTCSINSNTAENMISNPYPRAHLTWARELSLASDLVSISFSAHVKLRTLATHSSEAKPNDFIRDSLSCSYTRETGCT